MKKTLTFIAIFLCAVISGCSVAVISASSGSASDNAGIEKIDDSKAIIRYGRDAAAGESSDEKAFDAMTKYCSPKDYKIMVSGEKQSGENRFTKTVVFECVNNI
jgi:hypothetical protein